MTRERDGITQGREAEDGDRNRMIYGRFNSPRVMPIHLQHVNVNNNNNNKSIYIAPNPSRLLSGALQNMAN